MTGQGEVDLDVGEVAAIAAHSRRDAPVVAELSEDASELRRQRRRGHGDELVAFGCRHIVGRIEAVQCQEINNLAVHHILGADDASHFAICVLGKRGEFEVERDVGLSHIAVDEQQRVNGDVRAVEFFVLQERLVEVAEVGVERIDGFDVELCCEWVAGECYGAAVANGEVLDDNVLEREVVVAAREGVSSEHSQVLVGRVVGHTQVAVTVSADSIAAHGVHDEGHLRVGRDVDGNVHLIYAGLAAVVALGDALFQLAHGCGRRCGGCETVFARLVAVAEGYERIIIGVFGVAEHECKCRVGGRLHVYADVDDSGLAGDCRSPVAIDAAIPVSFGVFGDVVDEHIAGVGYIEAELRLFEIFVAQPTVEQRGVARHVAQMDIVEVDVAGGEMDGVGGYIRGVSEVEF